MKNVAHDYELLVVVDKNGKASFYDDDGNHVRLSEVVEVDFSELDKESVVSNEVAIIENQITKVKADSQASLTVLEGRKQELLSIGHEE